MKPQILTKCQKRIQPYEITPPVIKSGRLYLFVTESGVNYEVRFGRKQHNILSTTIVFGVTNEEYNGEEYSLTNKGETYKVMSTIAEIVCQYKKQHSSTNSFEYTCEQSSKEKLKKKNVRLMLYNRYIKQVFSDNWIIIKKENTVTIKKL